MSTYGYYGNELLDGGQPLAVRAHRVERPDHLPCGQIRSKVAGFVLQKLSVNLWIVGEPERGRLVRLIRMEDF